MWKYFKDKNERVYVFAIDGSQDNFIKPGLVSISQKEADELRKILSTADEIWGTIKTRRSEKLAGGVPVEHEGQVRWFDSDDRSRTQQQVLLGLGDRLPEGIQWKTLANDFVTMRPELAVAIAAATVRHDDAIFAAAEQHRLAMLALDDPTDYDFSIGWPQTYQDVLDEAARVKAEAEAKTQAEAAALAATSYVSALLPVDGVGESGQDLVADNAVVQATLSAQNQRIDALQAEMQAQFAGMSGLLEKLAAKLD